LTAEERSYLQRLLAKGKAAARKLLHARILLKTDVSGGGDEWTDEQLAEALVHQNRIWGSKSARSHCR